MPYIASILKKNFCSDPAMPIPFESPDHNFAVPHIGCKRALRLFPVRLLEFGTIDIFEIDRLTTALVMDRETIALMNGDDSRAKVRPRESRTRGHKGEHKTSRNVMLQHDSAY